MAQAPSLWVKLGLVDKDFDNGLKIVERKIKKVGDRLTSIGTRLSVGLSLPLALAAGAAIKTAAEVETATVAFTTLTGSVEKARQQMEALKKLTVETPFQFPELIDASRRMMAFGFSMEQTIPMIKIIGDAVSALGVGTEGLNNITLALGQMAMKGKVSAEEMTRQLGQYVNGWQYLADYLKVEVPEAMEMAKNGMISGVTGVKAVLEGLANDPKFAGGMQKQMETLSGLWSNFRDSLFFVLADIGNEIVTTFDLKDKLIGLINGLKTLNQWFKDLDPNIKKVVVNMTLFVAVIGPAMFLVGKLAGALSAIPALLATTGGKFALMAGSIGLVYVALDMLFRMMDQVVLTFKLAGTAILKTWLDAMTKIVEGSKPVLGIIPGMGKALEKAAEGLKKFRSDIALRDMVDTLLVMGRQDLPNAMKGMIALQKLLNTAVNQKDAEGIKYITNSMYALQQRIQELVKTAKDSGNVDLLKKLNFDPEQFKKLFEGMKDYTLGAGDDPDKEITDWMAGLRKAFEDTQAAEDDFLQNHSDAIDAILAAQGKYSDMIGKSIPDYEKSARAIEAEADALEKKEGVAQSQITLLRQLATAIRQQGEAYEYAAKKRKEMEDAQAKEDEEIANHASAVDAILDAERKLKDMKGEIIPEWEKEARAIEKQAYELEKLDGVLPEQIAYLRQLANEIRATGQAMNQTNNSFADNFQIGLSNALTGMQTWAEAVQDLAGGVAQSMGDMFSDFFTDVLQNNLKSASDYISSFLNGIARALANMLAQQMTSGILRLLFGAMFGGTAPAGQMMVGGQFTGAYANGGYIPPGKVGLVGENGPEIASGGNSGTTITPLNKIGGGDVQVIVNNPPGTPPMQVARQQTRFDGEKTVVELWMGAIARNAGGSRDMLKGVMANA
jgi:tape measure domain-containing protein